MREVDHARLTSLKIHACLFKPIKPDELDAAIQVAIATSSLGAAPTARFPRT